MQARKPGMQLTSLAILVCRKKKLRHGAQEDVERSKRGEGGKCKVGDRRGDGGRKFVVLNDRSEEKGQRFPAMSPCLVRLIRILVGCRRTPPEAFALQANHDRPITAGVFFTPQQGRLAGAHGP
jgi:hypothetical protein